MRIISGKFKGRAINPPRNLRARPTTDFAKENLFNVLNNIIDFEDCSVLDLFSGTAGISLEFLSRGCSPVISVELDSMHYSHQRKLHAKLGDAGWIPLRDDVFRFLRKDSRKYDIIFADPPYMLKELASIPEIVFERAMLKEDGIFIFEHGKDYDFSEHPNFMRHIVYGSVNFTIFTAAPAKNEEE
jgi:16S rRNA (guanine(966)-N(2))-methyltransferase RsmD